MTKRMTYQLTCRYSGLPIGQLSYNTVAGYMPYLSHWDKMVALHPVFSMPTSKLLAFARGEWNRLAKASDDGETTADEDNILRVCYLAVFHTLGGIIQEAPSLPPMHIVQGTMSKLFALAFWKHHLDSSRFAFPQYKINKVNANDRFDSVGYYLDACFGVKEDYENGTNDLAEKAKADAADRALKALRNSWIVPVGNKQLWKWVRAHLPAKYEADAQGWLSTIFLGNERTILDFDKDEIELLIEIIEGECPAGTGIMTAVRTRLDTIMQVYTDNKEAFSVDFADYEDSAPLAALRAASNAPNSTEAPKLADYPNKVAFIKANALWYLTQRAIATKADNTKAGDL